MLTDNLYQKILIKPARRNATLYIVSGYATAVMAAKHMYDIKEIREISDIKISLIIGMTAKDGISETNHNGICALVKNPGQARFECSYIPDDKAPVHAKTYAWFENESPICGFSGSANYTQTGFSVKQHEVMEPSDPKEIPKYYKKTEENSCKCFHSDVQGLIKENADAINFCRDSDSFYANYKQFEKVKYSLLSSGRTLAKRSGLNWGQRKAAGREPNQAYIRVLADIGNTSFFPRTRR